MLAFRRGNGLICVVNFTDEPLPLPASVTDGGPLISSTPDAVDGDGRLAANFSVWLSAS